VNQERIGFRVYPDVPAAQRADDVGVE
jgi:hypothetical protein